VLLTCSTFPIVNNRQITKAKSIMALLMVAMIMLCGVLVRTFFTSSPAHALDSVLLYAARKVKYFYSYGVLHHSLNFLSITWKCGPGGCYCVPDIAKVNVSKPRPQETPGLVHPL
jgi:uncharacterized membrane protein